MDPEDGREAERRPWERLSSWLECVCVVTFDLELGQAIELLYPPDVKLTEKEVNGGLGAPSDRNARRGFLSQDASETLGSASECGSPSAAAGVRRTTFTTETPPPPCRWKPRISTATFTSAKSRTRRSSEDTFKRYAERRRRPPTVLPSSARKGGGRVRLETHREPLSARRPAGVSVSGGAVSAAVRAALSRRARRRRAGLLLGGRALPTNSLRADGPMAFPGPRAERRPPADGRRPAGQAARLRFRRRFPLTRPFLSPGANSQPEGQSGKSADSRRGGGERAGSAAEADRAPFRPRARPLQVRPGAARRGAGRTGGLFPPLTFDRRAPRCFRSLLIHTQMLWELALLGEPLAVVAPSPAVSSETVLALVSCIAPLKFCCDFRPYFTVHDGEFREYTAKTRAPPNVILGVTNPFFVKTFHNWPHVLRLGESAEALGDGSPRPQASPRVRSERAPDKSPRLPSGEDVPKQLKIKKMAKLKTLDAKPGVFTAYKSFLLKDKVLIKRVLKGIQRRRPSEVQSAILRRHFLELTQSFIIPLERYMASLMPLQRSVTPWKTPPQIRPFSQDDFLSTLERGGPRLTSALRGDWTGLYRKFFKSPNFDGWYRRRLGEMTRKLESLHLEAVCLADVPGWTRDKSEVEIVDLVVKLREKLSKARRRRLQVREDLLTKLQSLIESIAGTLPKDLQDVLRAQ
ncbi:protein DENND6B isoform X3 [Corythoichthys intestinalis]|uniref:protein DENND6B isoform X3 n=1 Tax=Corythoichthys intestinalis TaxID=161448 RepID=UPI0025A56336|nr:protein DENND6B isoform X3 [Corythoichthys intestinalis]